MAAVHPAVLAFVISKVNGLAKPKVAAPTSCSVLRWRCVP
ncbi:Uncharacterised protein [Vibrio cholerae]|nr:Uncharacterised protein [Vibrio cholerae]